MVTPVDIAHMMRSQYVIMPLEEILKLVLVFQEMIIRQVHQKSNDLKEVRLIPTTASSSPPTRRSHNMPKNTLSLFRSLSSISAVRRGLLMVSM
jgi:hypothetical protein